MLFKKWPPASILDAHKSLFITFFTIFTILDSHNLFLIFDKMAAVGHFELLIAFLAISGHFDTELLFSPVAILDVRKSLSVAFLAISDRSAILDGTTMSIIELVRDIWMSNACVKFEERSLYPSEVIALTTVAAALPTQT